MRALRRNCIGPLLLLLTLSLTAAAAEVEVQALFTGAAMLKIDGHSKMLRAGQSHGGVTLLEADSRKAVVEINGQRQEVGVSQRISGTFTQPEQKSVRIPRDSLMQYNVQATLNGRLMQVMVDTGANVVAMNSAHARSLGIDFESGQSSQVQTAAGVVPAWIVTLDSLDVGGIRVDHVQASVVEGAFPATILLGMSYLKHVEMREKDGILLLSRSY